MNENVITPEYAELNQLLHRQRPNYGARGHRYIDAILRYCSKYKCKSVLDYGCGKATLREAWELHPRSSGISLISWDPCVPGLDTDPPECDFVFSSDVLEHVEPEFLDAAMDHLRAKTLKLAYLRISTRLDPSKCLPDGRNPHLSVHPAGWWHREFSKRFRKVSHLRNSGTHAFLLCLV